MSGSNMIWALVVDDSAPGDLLDQAGESGRHLVFELLAEASHQVFAPLVDHRAFGPQHTTAHNDEKEIVEQIRLSLRRALAVELLLGTDHRRRNTTEKVGLLSARRTFLGHGGILREKTAAIQRPPNVSHKGPPGGLGSWYL
jgi:hypothetical protein